MHDPDPAYEMMPDDSTPTLVGSTGGDQAELPPTTLPPPPPRVAPAPVSERERIDSIDVLRGFALLGILILNIQAFAMPGAAYMNPWAYGNLEGGNYWVWWLSQVFADQKFMTIFSMLFGAGICIMTSRAEERTGHSAKLHYRRMGWLILFGLLHAHLLWYGDILYFYGMCGLAVWPLRKQPPRVLIPIGLGMIVVASLISLFFGVTMPMWDPDGKQMMDNWQPTAAAIQTELAAYRGSWFQQMHDRVSAAKFSETMLLVIWGIWRAGGLMLIGIGLFKLGVFSAARSRRFYAGLALLGTGLGVPLAIHGLHQNDLHHWSVMYSFFLGSQWNYWASLLVSIGYVALVMLACKSSALATPLRPLAAVGRMAFTNYLMHTVICTTIFYGHGLGLFGYVERVGQIEIVLGVWIVQLIISPIWLKYFEFGPAEWLWRSLTYWKPQPFLA